MRRAIYLLAAVAAIVPSLVCAQQPAPAPVVAGSSEVAARVGDRAITVAEVDQAWRDADAPAQAQAAQAVYDGRKQALDRLVGTMLIERAANAKGVSVAQFTKDEIARRTKPIAPADVEAFYRQNVSRMQGKSLDEMREPIHSFLQQQQEEAARGALVAELRKAGPPISVALEPPRQQISVASNEPSRGGASASVVVVEYSDYQ